MRCRLLSQASAGAGCQRFEKSVQNAKKFNLRFLAMATNTTAMDKQLATLKTATRNVLLQIRKTNKQEREHLAAIYVWWRSVKDVTGYLTDLYAKHGIEYYNIKNKINFRPLLTYLTNGDVESNDLNYWQQTLRAHRQAWTGWR